MVQLKEGIVGDSKVLIINLKKRIMVASKIEIKKVCEFCGKEFLALKRTTRFCSKTCMDRAYKQKLRKQQVQEVENHVKEIAMNNPFFIDVKTKDYLSPLEASKLIGVTTRSIYNLIYSSFGFRFFVK